MNRPENWGMTSRICSVLKVFHSCDIRPLRNMLRRKERTKPEARLSATKSEIDCKLSRSSSLTNCLGTFWVIVRYWSTSSSSAVVRSLRCPTFSWDDRKEDGVMKYDLSNLILTWSNSSPCETKIGSLKFKWIFSSYSVKLVKFAVKYCYFCSSEFYRNSICNIFNRSSS